ncbi:MAG TPA: hypothetical protein DEO56_02165 [Nitrosomonas nitrosa]|nr:hypothetical protein [Nitrosomonas nitrosa]
MVCRQDGILTPLSSLLSYTRNDHTSKISLHLPAIRCLSKQEAAVYLGIGVTLLTELDIPCIKTGPPLFIRQG